MGRFDTDTNQLENAIIVEGRRERLRLVSVPSLISLLELKQEYHLAHETILDLLLPSPIKIDPIVELIRNVVAQEQERDGVEPELELPIALIDPDQPKATVGEPQKAHQSTKVLNTYTNKKVQAIVFDGQRVEVTKWRDAVEAVMVLMVKKDLKRFEQVAPQFVGRKRPYITANPDLLRAPRRIEGTDLYFESNFSANDLTWLARQLVEKMGYRPEVLVFETD
jgi:hypothetical protein